MTKRIFVSMSYCYEQYVPNSEWIILTWNLFHQAGILWIKGSNKQTKFLRREDKSFRFIINVGLSLRYEYRKVTSRKYLNAFDISYCSRKCKLTDFRCNSVIRMNCGLKIKFCFEQNNTLMHCKIPETSFWYY